jgi:hypothetical protein
MNAAAVLFAFILAIAGTNASPEHRAAPHRIVSDASVTPAIARRVRQHPLYAVVQQYDREISALRATENVDGLSAISSRVARANESALRDASDAGTRAARDATHANDYRRREDRALDASAAAVSDRMQRAYAGQSAQIGAAARQGMTDYRNDLARESRARVKAFEAAMALRTRRALEARAAQLREKESTLAFDLERRDAAKRLLLRLKLDDLHLQPASRKRYAAALRALDATVRQRVDVLRAADDAVLAAYRVQLVEAQAQADAHMAAAVASKGAANLALRRQVLAAQSVRGALVLPAGESAADAAATTATLRANFNASSEDRAIGAAFARAGNDLSQRFARLRQRDRASRQSTDAQIAALQSARSALYAAIVAAVTRPSGSQR